MDRLNRDVIVVGGGPAGLCAALAAARGGCSVGIIDMQPHPGGQIWRRDRGQQRRRQARELWRACSLLGVSWHGSTTVFDAPAPTTLLASSPAGAVRLRGRTIILATGARELILPFEGWTLPGVLTAGGLQALVKSGFDPSAKRIVVAGTGPLLVAVTAALAERGAALVDLVERVRATKLLRLVPAMLASPSKIRELAGFHPLRSGIRISLGTRVSSARKHEDGLIVRLQGPRGEREVRCDLLACSDGLIPQTRLARLLGCRIDDGAVAVDELQRTSVDSVLCAGEPTGVGGADLARLEGEVAGWVASGCAPARKPNVRRRSRARRFAASMARTFARSADPIGNDTVVCRCEGTRFGDVARYGGLRVAKLQSRCAMGSCQGRTCGPALEHALGWPGAEAPRPPLFPISCGVLAGAWSEVEP